MAQTKEVSADRKRVVAHQTGGLLELSLEFGLINIYITHGQPRNLTKNSFID